MELPGLTQIPNTGSRRVARDIRRAAFFTVAAVIYGNAVNFLPQDFHNGAYVPLNAAAGLLAGIVAWRVFGLDARALGLDRRGVVPGLLFGVLFGIAIVAPLFLALLVPPARELIADDTRHAGLTTAGFLYTVLVRIPIGTALFEEWLFRGVLFAVWLKVANPRGAYVVPSLAFGLWHIVSTAELVHVARPDPSVVTVALIVAGGIVATTIAGLLFTYLRVDTRGVVGPGLTHALINSLAVVAATLARAG